MLSVGLLFSLTGTTALTERGQCDAAKFAIEECNKDHVKVQAIVRDICSDPMKTAKEAESLAKEGIKVFIGCYSSACRKAVLPVLEKYDCLLVYPTLYEGKECHPNVFYSGEVPNQQVHTLLHYLTSHYGKRIYCIGSDYIYSRETVRQVKTYLKENNGELIGEKYVPFGYQKFDSILEEVILKQPDAIFSTIVGQSMIPFYKAYKRLNPKPEKMPIFSPIMKESEITMIGESLAAGHYSSASYFQSFSNLHNRIFIQKFHDYLGEKRVISSTMYNTYLGAKIILESILEENNIDYRHVFEQLSGKKIETACGPVSIERDYCHLSRPVKIGRALPNGQFEIVWDSNKSIPAKPFRMKARENDYLDENELEVWGKLSEEALFVISQHDVILYLSKKGKELTKLAEGQRLTKELYREIYELFEVIHYKTNHQQIILLKEKINDLSWQPPYCFGRIQTMNHDYQMDLQVAQLSSQSTANVLILGETGTGKEMIARSIHEQSDRRNEPFIPVNTAMLPKELIASELFGYVEGAFTGAKKGGAIGKFEAANNGTLFLDEIGDMPLDLQVVLLRVIESKTIVRIGDNKERAVDVRIIAATNRNLQEEIAYNASFRSDLFYRLNVLSIHIPPLRERPEDIAHLCKECLREIHQTYGEGPIAVSDEALVKLTQYQWPGNIRELRNVMERAFLLAGKSQSRIQLSHLPRIIKRDSKGHATVGSLRKNEKRIIEQVLKETRTINEACSILGIARSTLYRKIQQFGITRSHFQSSK